LPAQAQPSILKEQQHGNLRKRGDLENIKKQLEAIAGQQIDVAPDQIVTFRWPMGADNRPLDRRHGWQPELYFLSARCQRQFQ
jgi:hypothetical protein